MASFNLTRFNTPVTVADLRVRPGDLLFADGDGCVRLPVEHAADILRLAGEVRAKEAAMFDLYRAPDLTVAKLRAQRGAG